MKNATPTLVKLVGASGAGKTTLAEGLLRALRRAGLRLGYVKHAAHGFDLDRPGKDSARAAAAGACGVALLGPTGIAFLASERRVAPEDLARRFFADADLVLIEGFSRSGIPTLLFPAAPARGRAKPPPRGRVLAHVWPTRAAAAADRSGVPAYARNDVRGLARRVLEALALRAPRAPRARRR